MSILHWIKRQKGKSHTPLRGPRGWDLSATLLHWTDQDNWTIRHAIEGTLICGATGSGKSSGPGRSLALAMLRSGFGGLVLTVKPDECALWREYCEAAGRSADLLEFSPAGPHRFNVLDYELNRKGVGAGLTENIVGLFSTILEFAERGRSGASGQEEGAYWGRATRQLIRNAVDLLILAKGRISVPDLHRAITSAPISMAQVRSEEWRASSACFRWLTEADKLPKSPRQCADFEIVADFFLVEFPNLADRTRSVIISSFSSMADLLLRGVLAELFSGETNLSPEAIQDGKIVVIDLPVKEFGETGLFAQVWWKKAFQDSIERRSPAGGPRPVFLWMDEAQMFVGPGDAMFQTTCRSSRVATVMLTQNVSNFYSALSSGDKGRAQADSLFANLNTKVLCANGDAVTNEWAASLIGRSRQFLASGSMSYTAEDNALSALGLGCFNRSGPSTTSGFSEHWDYEVQPSAFTRLRTGGVSNGRCVDAIVFQNGRVFRSNRRTWLPVTFRQAAPAETRPSKRTWHSLLPGGSKHASPEPSQGFGNGRGQSKGLLACIAGLVRGLAASVEVFLHDADSFGARYLRRRAGSALLLLFIQAVFWRDHNLDGLVLFGLAFLLRWLYVLARTSRRVNGGGVEPHSEYTGTPLLMRVFKRAGELRTKEGYEPLLVVIVALCLIEWSPPLGFYLIYAAVGLGMSVTMCRVYQRERAIDLNDACLEQRSIVEQFHDMRGE